MPLLADLAVATVAALVAAAVAAAYPWRARAAGSSSLRAAAQVGRAARGRPWLARAVRARLDPEVKTGLLLTAALATAVAGGTVLAIFAYLTRSVDAVQRLDDAAAAWGGDHATSVSRRGLRAVTFLGETTTVAAVAAAVALVDVVRRRTLVPAAFLAAAIAGSGLLTAAVKALADRARPALDPLAASLGPSFPSGHSSTAAVSYAAVALVLARRARRPVRVAAAALAVGVAVAVAGSRVLLDVHWLSDVVAGVALGWAWFAICAIAFGGRLLRPEATQAAAERAAAPESGPGREPGPAG